MLYLISMTHDCFLPRLASLSHLPRCAQGNIAFPPPGILGELRHSPQLPTSNLSLMSGSLSNSGQTHQGVNRKTLYGAPSPFFSPLLAQRWKGRPEEEQEGSGNVASFPWCRMGYLAAVLSLERGPSKCCRPGGQAGFSTCPQPPLHTFPPSRNAEELPRAASSSHPGFRLQQLLCPTSQLSQPPSSPGTITISTITEGRPGAAPPETVPLISLNHSEALGPLPGESGAGSAVARPESGRQWVCPWPPNSLNNPLGGTGGRHH